MFNLMLTMLCHYAYGLSELKANNNRRVIGCIGEKTRCIAHCLATAMALVIFYVFYGQVW